MTSAIELNDERKEQIKVKIAEKLKKEVIVDWGVDSEIIAGLIFNIDEMIIDNSIKHKLEDLMIEYSYIDVLCLVVMLFVCTSIQVPLIPVLHRASREK